MFFSVDFSGHWFNVLFEIHQPDTIIAKILSKDTQSQLRCLELNQGYVIGTVALQVHGSCVTASAQAKEKGAKHKWRSGSPCLLEFDFIRTKYFPNRQFSVLTDVN